MNCKFLIDPLEDNIFQIYYHRSALTECSVLLDVLQVGKDKKYMVLDPVTQEAPEQKTGVQLLAKKRVRYLY